MCEAALTLVDRSHASAIVAITRGGKTARVLSALRPRVPIFAVTDHPEVARQLALRWGVFPVVASLEGELSTAVIRIVRELVVRGVIEPSSSLVVARVTPKVEAGQLSFLTLGKA